LELGRVDFGVSELRPVIRDLGLIDHSGSVRAQVCVLPHHPSIDFQEFMIVRPRRTELCRGALRYGAETFHALHDLLHNAGYSTAVGDEGGFAPNLKSIEEACELIVAAVRKAGLRPGGDVASALDRAATSFAEDGRYVFAR